MGRCGVVSSPTRVGHAKLVVAAGLAFVLASCAPASTSVAAPAAASEATTACPTDAFDVFIERFGREIAFQELTTADPLVIERYDAAAEPEPRRVVEEIAVADIAWPVMPRLDPDDDGRRTHAFIPTADGRMEVHVRWPDTSDQQRYVFGRAPCWQLQRVIDDSI
ncbi:hypothetical protein CMZ84_06575 [Lysobacteraceae bacterium NML93-0399]|nr:hypothetical protein CMZ84_06575 [Xanthomonadaceae bacterium NML93-0399]